MQFNLTTGKTIYVDDTPGFEWLGQCSLDELDMEPVLDETGNKTSDIKCLTERADKIAGDVWTLWDRQTDYPGDGE